MTSHNSRVALSLGIVFSLSLLLTACNKSATPPEQAAAPADQSASAPASQPAPQSAMAPAAAPAAAVAAPAPAAVPPPPPPPPPRIPAGTAFSARLSSGVSSKTSSAGDPFNGTLVSPIRLDGNVIIPAGSAVSGVVSEAHSAGRFKGAATLAVRLVSVNVGGRAYPIRTSVVSAESKGKGKRTGGLIGGGAGGGALIGGLAGGGKGALIGGLIGAGAGTAGAGLTGNNRDIDYPAETVLTFRLTGSLNLGPG